MTLKDIETMADRFATNSLYKNTVVIPTKKEYIEIFKKRGFKGMHANDITIDSLTEGHIVVVEGEIGDYIIRNRCFII